MIFGIVLFPRGLSRQGKTQEFFDKFKAGIRTHEKWVFGCKNGSKVGRNPFSPTLNPFRDFREKPLFSQFKGGGNCFLERAMRQSRPSIIPEWRWTGAFGLRNPRFHDLGIRLT